MNKQAVVSVIALAAVLAGCRDKGASSTQAPEMVANAVPMVEVAGAVRENVPQDAVYSSTVQANAVNNTAGDYAVEWKVVWLDADGLAIDSVVSTWNKRMIAAKDVVGLTSTAPCREAVDMMFYLRRLR